MNTSVIGGTTHSGLQCNITDVFGWFLQVLLAALAFTCLICKLQTEWLLSECVQKDRLVWRSQEVGGLIYLSLPFWYLLSSIVMLDCVLVFMHWMWPHIILWCMTQLCLNCAWQYINFLLNPYLNCYISNLASKLLFCFTMYTVYCKCDIGIHQ